MNNSSLRSRRTGTGGYVVILNTLIFVAVSTFVIYALAAPLVASNRAAASILESKRVFIVAGSAAEETLYKLKKQMTVPAFATLELDGISADVTVSTGFGGRTVEVKSQGAEVERDLRIGITESTGVSFHYGLQSGQGGFDLYGGAKVFGNLYSNGPVVGFGGASVSGSVTVANASAPTADQSNGSGTPSNEIAFGGQLVYNDLKFGGLAQSFKVSTTTPVSSVRFYIKKYSATDWMGDATVKIMNNASGKPGNTTLASATLSADQVTAAFSYLTLPFTSTPALTPGTTYWLVFVPAYDWGNYFIVGANQNGYAAGAVKVKEKDSSTWKDATPANLDIFFDLYTGGTQSGISGLQNNRLSIGGDAWAHSVSGANVTGSLYCQTASYTNKTCDASRPDAVEQPMPVSDGNIEAWKDEASAGGIETGSVNVGWQGLTIGPKKIVGDLTVSGGGVLTVTGTLYVTGNVTVNGGGTVKLADSYGGKSGIIVADGRVTTTGGGTVQGNGVAGNYILIVTTSQCPNGASCGNQPAVTLSGGAGAVILNAQKGALQMTGGAKAKQLTADRIIMDGGTEVHYETGLMDMNFDSGPSGSWSIASWDEI